MKSQSLRNIAELLTLFFGGLLLSAQGSEHVFDVLLAAPALSATAYGAGELTGELIHAVCPLAIGIGLFLIAYRRREYTNQVNVQSVQHGAQADAKLLRGSPRLSSV